MAKTTSSEFTMWMIHLDKEMNRHDKIDYYLAQIATEVRRGNVKDPKKLKLNDALIQFEKAGKKKKNKNTPSIGAKAFFFGMLGMNPKDEQ